MKKVKSIISFLWSSFKAKPLEVLGLVATIIALQLTRTSNSMTNDSLDISKQALVQSDSQFKENNKSQNEQDGRSKEQHDSLMNVLKQQKSLLDLQLGSLKYQNQVTKRNLIMTEKIQNEQLIGKRCILTVSRVIMKDSSLKMNNFSRPHIVYEYSNMGERPCLNYKVQCVIISKSWEIFSQRPFLIIEGTNPINNKEVLHGDFTAYIDDVKDFYFYINLVYNDTVTGSNSIEYFFHYFPTRNVYGFYVAKPEEKSKIKKLLAENK
jgi:hypothetical protein